VPSKETAPPEDPVPKQLADIAWPVSTARLMLRRATAADADVVLSYRRLPSVSEWIGDPPEDFHARFVAPERLEVLLLIERAGGVIGDLMIKIEDAWAPARMISRARGVEAELGWSLRPEETGLGYATEAVQAALQICFEGLGLRRVTATCFTTNVASYRLMERVGMRREAHLVQHALHPTGEWLDGYSYGLLADEWRRARC
jgi:RimJ/RimL family protein N-acetyltransferase